MSFGAGKYQGKSIGKQIHFLYHYFGGRGSSAYECIFGTDSITLFGKTIAVKTNWKVVRKRLKTGEEIEIDVPVFCFLDPVFAREQIRKEEEAISNLAVVANDRVGLPIPKLHPSSERY